MAHETLRIVIADNESIIRMDLREMLEEAGHEIVGEAIDGRKAVELTRQHRPDLVIMDIKMPQMDGITAARKISEEKLAPVLLLTAFSQPEIVEKAKDSGVLGYLVKPVQENNLFPAIEIAMSRWREMQGLEQELAGLRDSLAMRKTLDHPAVRDDEAPDRQGSRRSHRQSGGRQGLMSHGCMEFCILT